MAGEWTHRWSRLVLVLGLCCCRGAHDDPPRSEPDERDAGGASPAEGDEPVQAGGGSAGDETGQAGTPATSQPDTEPPRLVSSVPVDGDDNVAWPLRPHLLFSEPVTFAEGALTLRQVRPARVLPLSATLGPDQRSIELVIGEAPDVPSELILELGEDITDLAGNPLEPSALHFALPIWLRLGAELNRDAAVSASDVRLARDSANRLVMLSVEGGNVYASRYQDGAWQQLGGAMNEGRTLASPAPEPRIALTIDGSDAPLAAFREDGGVVALRWDGDVWQQLGRAVDPDGGGSYAPALALAEDGQPVIAFDSSAAGSEPSLRLRELAGKDWQILAEISAPTHGVRLAGDGKQPVTLAYQQASGGLRTLRWNGSRLGALGAGSVLEAASGGFALSVSGDLTFVSAEGHGSAQLERGAWHSIEPDVGFLNSSAARERSLLHAPDGSLVAAFAEIASGEQAPRVYCQRLADGRFMPLGPALNRERDAAATQPALTLGLDGEPIVAFLETPAATGSTKIYAARYNGDPLQPPTGLDELKHQAGCLAQAPPDGSSLLESGCFAGTSGREPVAGFVPFDVASPLWSDGASKRRFFMLPAGESIAYRDPGIWTFPPGSILIKEFAIEGRRGDPSSLRPVETRLLVVRAKGDWDRYSYQWNQAGTEAVLRPAAPATPLVTFAVESEQGMPAEQVHFYPSRAQCLSCHQAPGTVLGLQTAMLNRNFDYGATVDNQLRSLARIGAFGGSFTPASLRSASFMPSPVDTTYATEARLRAYLHANCSSCHHPLEGLDLRIQTPTAESGLCSKITKGSLEDSLLYWRDVRRGNVGQPGVAPMPPLGTLVPNPVIESLLGDWIVDPQNPCP